PAVTMLTAPVAAGTQQTATLKATSGMTTPPSNLDTPIPWNINVGSTIMVDTGVNQETVIVAGGASPTIVANFQRNHAAGAPVYIPGNPGPQSLFDPQDPKYSPVVPYIAILQ